MAEVAPELWGASARQAERRFGGGRETVEKGLDESRLGMWCLEDFAARGWRRGAAKDPQLAVDLRGVVEPRTCADPGLKSERRYTNLSAAAAREALVERGYRGAEWPSERTRRAILNRMNDRLQRLPKGQPSKKTAATDAIFANARQVRDQPRDDGETLEISRDTKAKVNLGEYARGGKNRDRRRR